MKKKLALLGAVVMVGTSLVPTIASADDPAFTCTDAGGVWVVVTEVGQNCAWNNPSTGLEALSQAGFWVSEAPSDKGFIIQISVSQQTPILPLPSRTGLILRRKPMLNLVAIPASPVGRIRILVHIRKDLGHSLVAFKVGGLGTVSNQPLCLLGL